MCGMKRKLLTDIELDVQGLKYLMESFSKESTVTLSELLKRNILQLQERLELLLQEVEETPLTEIPTAPVALEEEYLVVEVPSQKAIVGDVPQLTAEEDKTEITEVLESARIEVTEPEVVAIEECKDPEIETPRTSVLGERIRLGGTLRQSISLNDSFRFSQDVFSGDSEFMNRMIEQISAMSSYSTAVAFLASKVTVDEKNESMNDFLELLKRYFNQSA